MAANAKLYDRDFYAWTLEQAALLREGRFGEADVANIVEEIETMGRREKRELVNRLVVLLKHLAKWRSAKTKKQELAVDPQGPKTGA